MKAFSAIFAFLLFTLQALCGWTPINTGIADDFTSICFKGNVGFMTGKKGTYVSTNVGTTAGTWARVQNFVTPSDSIIYNHSQFYSSVPAISNNVIYFCGRDTINSTGVIFVYNLNTNNLELIHTGGTKFNKIESKPNSNHIYVVGNNGSLLYFSETNPVVNSIPTSYSFDLTALSISWNTMLIGSNDYLIDGTIDSSFPNIISFSQNYLPTRNFRDVELISTVSLYAVGKNYARRQSSLTISEPHQYYADSLMGNSVTYSSNQLYIGTNNGIYKSVGSGNIMEFQPSSTGHTIHDIAYVNSSNLIACGNNGTILFSTDLGGVPEPYAQIDYNGGCSGTSQSISSTKGTVTSCYNYIDNVYLNSNCNSYGYLFPTPGTHEIKLTVSNGSYTKTITKLITTVPVPQINFLTAVSDTILCKQEVLDITLSNTENSVYYSLYKSGSSANYGNSQVGNGNSISFQSNGISLAGTYYIRANSSIVGCSKNFTNLITIQVEKPASKIYYDIVNAEVNEEVRFYQRSSQATTFEWHFSNSPALATSNQANPTNSFTGIGSSQVTLISGTPNNCFDSLTIRGPFIYEPYSDSSWLLLNSRTAVTTNNINIGEDIIKTIKSRTGGYVVIGNYLHRQLNSRIGDSINLPGLGQYAAKYTDRGILKWCMKSVSINTTAFDAPIITDVTEDSQGNLYFTGGTASYGMIDNRGDTILPFSSFLLKTDSLGRTIWTRSSSIYQTNFLNVTHDYSDNIYLTVGIGSATVPFLFNGNTGDTLSDYDEVCATCNDNFRVMKLNNNGVKLGDFLIEISAANEFVTPKVVFDTLSNMYLWGSREIFGVIHEPSTGDTIELYDTPDNYRGNMYICKFDVNGNYQWKMQGYTRNASNDQTEVLQLISDESGNLYATGTNDYNYYIPNSPQVIVNADNSQTEFYGGKYFISKISPEGMTQWIHGNSSSDYGMGYDILKDGDTLYIVGATRSYNNTNLLQEFSGENNLLVSVNSNPYNYFINKYTVNGEILGVYLNAPTSDYTGLQLDELDYPNLIKLDDGYFLLNKSISIYLSGSYSGYDFGFNLPYTYFPQDGTQLKIKLNQGIEFLPQYLAHVYDTICYGSSYFIPNGTELPNLTTATLYEDSMLTSTGIDSITRYHIFVNAPSIHYQQVQVCFGENYEIANDTIFTNIESAFTYDQLIVSPTSCDSIIRYQFTVNPVVYTLTVATICEGSDLVLGNGIIAATNMQHDSIVEIVVQSIYGCDSTININVHVIEVNELVNQNGNVLSGQDPWASYQWVNCSNNFSAVPGQNGITFTPVVNGNYAAIVTRDGCTDTSACFQVNGLSLSELGYDISVYPNPTNSKSVIDFGQTLGSAGISIYSNDGRKIFETHVESITKYELDLGTFEKGTYFVRIITEENKQSEFILIKN